MALREELTQATTSPSTTSQITLSERAASELKALIEENNKGNAALRVWVAGGGCSGLQYGMALDDADDEADDVVLTDRGVKVVVDSMRLLYMAGAVVDCVDATLGRGVKLDN